MFTVASTFLDTSRAGGTYQYVYGSINILGHITCAFKMGFCQIGRKFPIPTGKVINGVKLKV